MVRIVDDAKAPDANAIATMKDTADPGLMGLSLAVSSYCRLSVTARELHEGASDFRYPYKTVGRPLSERHSLWSYWARHQGRSWPNFWKRDQLTSPGRLPTGVATLP